MQDLTIGTTGLVISRKGVDTFLKIAKSFPEKNFFWFGKVFNPVFSNSLPRELPPNVVFTGNVAHQNIPSVLNALDIFFFPSYEETQGISLLEAAATGLPILCRDIPAYNPWLIHKVNCLKAKNDQEFAKYLKMLINDSKLRKRLGRNAYKLAQNEDVKVLAKGLNKIYEKLLEKNSY